MVQGTKVSADEAEAAIEGVTRLHAICGLSLGVGKITDPLLGFSHTSMMSVKPKGGSNIGQP